MISFALIQMGLDQTNELSSIDEMSLSKKASMYFISKGRLDIATASKNPNNSLAINQLIMISYFLKHSIQHMQYLSALIK